MAELRNRQLDGLAFGMALFLIAFAAFAVNQGNAEEEVIDGVVEGCDFPGSMKGGNYPRASVLLANGETVQVFVEASRCTADSRIRVRKERGKLFFNTRYVPADA